MRARQNLKFTPDGSTTTDTTFTKSVKGNGSFAFFNGIVVRFGRYGLIHSHLSRFR